MPNAFWCIVEDDRNGSPKKVMAEVLGEAARLAPGRVEAVWLTDKASDAGLKQLGHDLLGRAVSIVFDDAPERVRHFSTLPRSLWRLRAGRGRALSPRWERRLE